MPAVMPLVCYIFVTLRPVRLAVSEWNPDILKENVLSQCSIKELVQHVANVFEYSTSVNDTSHWKQLNKYQIIFKSFTEERDLGS